jgi:hypothetical protein
MTGDENPGDLLTATNPWGGVRAWLHHGPDGPGDGLADASCPSPQFCGVIDANGDIDAFSPGDSTHFTDTGVADAPDAIACPSRRLCVAVAGGYNDNSNGGGVWSSTDPAAAHPRWRQIHRDANEELAVACHGVHLCIAVDYEGRASFSSNPGAAAAVWSTQTVDPVAIFSAVSCPTAHVCIAADTDGQVMIAHRP